MEEAADLASPTDETPLVPARSQPSRCQKVIGWAFIIFCAANDIAQSEYTQWKDSSVDFKSFVFLTWLTSVFLVFSFPLFLFVDYARHRLRSTSARETYGEHLHAQLASFRAMSSTTFAAAMLSTLFLFFFSTYLWYLNLDMVPVSISFALSHSEILFVITLSWLLLRMKITWKQAAVLVVLAIGLGLIASGKSHSSRFSVLSQLWGSGIIFLATMLWGLYEVIFKRFFSDFSTHSLMLLQTFWGLSLIAFALVVFPALWYSGLEPPPSLDSATLGFLTSSVLFAAPYFFVYPLAVVYTSPFEVSLGSLCSIPVTAIVDRLLWGTTYPLASLFGMAIIALSLVLHGLLEAKHK